MPIDRTSEEFHAYRTKLEELAWNLVGHCEEYEALMEDATVEPLAYVEALELLILNHGKYHAVDPSAGRAC